jgi:hypothetical protein
VTTYTSHLKPNVTPLVVREGFSWWAALFGWLWLLVNAAWIPAILLFAASVAVGRLVTALQSPAPVLGLMLLQGLFGRDLLRWGLARRGFVPGPVVEAASQDSALVRLLTERADLLNGLAGARL